MVSKEYWSGVSTPVMNMIFALVFCGKGEWRRKRRWAAAFLVVLVGDIPFWYMYLLFLFSWSHGV